MAGEILKAGTVLKIGQRIEFYVENDDNRYASRIEDMTKEQIIAALPVNKQRVPIIPRKGARIYALAVGDQCRYRFFSTYIGSEKRDGRIPVWIITRPETVERHQNREFVRVRVDLRVRARLVGDDGTISDPIETRTLDLSGNGVALVLPKPVKIDSQMALEIFDIPEVGTLEVMGRVARCQKVQLDDEHALYHVGALLEHIERRTMNQIVRYLFSVQRKAIAKGINGTL